MAATLCVNGIGTISTRADTTAFAGDVDIQGNAFFLGTWANDAEEPGFNLSYTDGTTLLAPASLDFTLTRPFAQWVWSHDNSTQTATVPIMKLDSSHRLNLFSSTDSSTPKIVLDPDAGQILVDGVAIEGGAGFSRIVVGSGASAGEGSIAVGSDAVASGTNSAAFGERAAATGPYSFAAGSGSTASGDYAVALGYFSSATGDYSFAVGPGSSAGGAFSFALGGGSANGIGAVTLGAGSANGYYSTAIGGGTVGDGGSEANYSTAMGSGTVAFGNWSTAMGAGYAVEDYSTAMGNSWATGIGATAMGFGDSACSFATAMGKGNAHAPYSTATGENTLATGAWQLVTGRYNVSITNVDEQNYPTTLPTFLDPSDSLFIIGNGTDDTHRSNAFTVNASGDVGAAGKITAAGAQFSGVVRITPQGDLSMGEFTQEP